MGVERREPNNLWRWKDSVKTKDYKQHVELRVQWENVSVCLCMCVVLKQGNKGNQSK